MKRLKLIMTLDLEVPNRWKVSYPTELASAHVQIGTSHYLPVVNWISLAEHDETSATWHPVDDEFNEGIGERVLDCFHEIIIEDPK